MRQQSDELLGSRDNRRGRMRQLALDRIRLRAAEDIWCRVRYAALGTGFFKVLHAIHNDLDERLGNGGRHTCTSDGVERDEGIVAAHNVSHSVIWCLHGRENLCDEGNPIACCARLACKRPAGSELRPDV